MRYMSMKARTAALLLLLLPGCFFAGAGTASAQQTEAPAATTAPRPAVKLEAAGACRNFSRERVEWGVAPARMTQDERDRHMTSDIAAFPSAVLDLLDAGANVNAVDSAGFTALMYAAQKGRGCVVKILLDNGADPNVVGDTDGKGESRTTALKLARERLEQQQELTRKGVNQSSREAEYQEVVDLLTAAGAATP